MCHAAAWRADTIDALRLMGSLFEAFTATRMTEMIVPMVEQNHLMDSMQLDHQDDIIPIIGYQYRDDALDKSLGMNENMYFTINYLCRGEALL